MQTQEAVTVAARWHALWTRSHCEQLVFDQLVGKGFQPFLPKMTRWNLRGGVKHRSEVPMFPGYLFLHHALDKHAYLSVIGTRGMVQVLGGRWDHLAVIPEQQMAAVERLAFSAQPLRSHPYLRSGERVRIHEGPLAGVEGILVRFSRNKHLVVVSLELLQRSVAVEVDSAYVAAA